MNETIRKAWLTNHPIFGSSVSDRLSRCRKALSRWKKEQSLNSRDKIHQIQVNLEQEQSAANPRTIRVNYLKKELLKEYKEEEKYWAQRSKDKWTVCGDRNTKFFHASVKERRAKNSIGKLLDENGIPQFSEAAKGEVASKYFTKLFSSSSSSNLQDFFQGFTPAVTVSMNEQLTREVSKEEIKEAVFSIKGASAAGADGNDRELLSEVLVYRG